MNNAVHFSSKTPEWATPQSLFDELDREFHFTLDPCSTHENAKCQKHFTMEDDGLAKDWGGEIVFMNPPYGREIGKWVEKAWSETREREREREREEMHGRNLSFACPNRHKMVSQCHLWQGRNQIFAWAC